ncbi:MAG: NAD(P)H-dependent oxidoreductase [Clostridia bacterium]|nr:NAD(P)H-dependent oxidoreductase [Clostridia bacterium]
MCNVLVAYFSATGNTEACAKKLAQAINADIFEIVPVTPYTAKDLNWQNAKSRSSLEMKDKNSRPQIAGLVEEMSKYDVIFVGFPIWWYVAPTIINTFLEQYNLSEKTIVPFATSGSSGMGKTNEKLAPSCPDSRLMEGRRFALNTSAEEFASWAADFI